MVARNGFVFLLFLGTASALLSSRSDGQEQGSVKLPAGLQQMSPDEFAAAIRTLQSTEQYKLLSDSDQEVVQARAKELFSQVDVAKTELSYQTVEMLHWPLRHMLDPGVSFRLKTALLARQDEWAGRPYAEIRSKIFLMLRLKCDDGSVVTEGRKWVLAGGTKDQIPAADLRHYFVRECFDDVRLIDGSFSVEWAGLITPTQTGRHQFSISPINLNSSNPRRPVKLTMTVSIDGQQILNSSPQPEAPANARPAWISESSPVTLTAGQPVSLKVTFSADVPAQESSSVHAILSWQGPDGATSVVPASVLKPVDSENPGIRATYTWTANGQAQTLSRVERNIDAAWLVSPILIGKTTTMSQQGADEMWNSLTSRAFLNICLETPTQRHPFLGQPNASSTGLTTARRVAFLAQLQQNPTLLDSLNPKTSVEFYQAYRIGAPDAALDVFGLWAQRYADYVSGIAVGKEFEDEARVAFGRMATLTTLQLPNHANRLQNEFLQLASGSCSLPVAYILASSYNGQGRLADWIVFLEGKASDPGLSKDAVVNWLIARAYAEEIRGIPQNLDQKPDAYSMSRALDGYQYLDKALRTAQTPAVKVRVVREMAARLVWGGQFQAAQDLLKQNSNSLPTDQQAIVAGIQTRIAALATAENQAPQLQAAAAKAAYLATLKDRRDKAAARGDTAAVERYEGLLSSASGK